MNFYGLEESTLIKDWSERLVWKGETINVSLFKYDPVLAIVGNLLSGTSVYVAIYKNGQQ